MRSDRWLRAVLMTSVLSLSACTGDAKKGPARSCEAGTGAACGCEGGLCGSTSQGLLEGRVFDAETARALEAAELKAGSGVSATSDAMGHFELPAEKDPKQVEISKRDYVDAVKQPPAQGGYMEVFIKDIDESVEFEADKGVTVALDSGTSLTIPGAAVRDAEGKLAEGSMRLNVAEVDGWKRSEAAALPGNLEGEGSKGERGQVAIHRALAITIVDRKGQQMQVDAKADVVAEFPAHKDDGAAEHASLSYEEAKGRWVEEGKVRRSENDKGEPVYRKDIDHLSWHSYGDFFSTLTCLRACVEDGDGKRLAGAQVWLVGASFPGVSTLFTGSDGCVAGAAPVTEELVLVAQVEAGVSRPERYTTGATERAVADGAAACEAVEVLVIGAASASACPAGFEACGSACVDAVSGEAACMSDAGMQLPADAGSLDAAMADAGAVPFVGFDQQEAYVKSSMPAMNALFGSSVAISGDTLVVGAYQEPSGSVYVFVRSGTTWVQQAQLKASNAGPGDEFGYSVSISGDTLVVGAHYEDSNARVVDGDGADNSSVDSGAAYVFVRTAGVWTQQAYLKADNADAEDSFGTSVSVSGDTAVVAAAFEDSNARGVNQNGADNSASLSGAAYVFVRNGETWTQQAYLKASNGELDDAFGFSTAISGDTIVVGAINEASSATGVNQSGADNGAANSGAAYVFARSAGTWSQQAYLKGRHTGPDDRFGWSVAASGDSVVVGALYEDGPGQGVNQRENENGTIDNGAAYVFVRSAGNWTQQAYIKASNADVSSGFGQGVSMAGNVLLVGAPYESSRSAGVNQDQTDTSLGSSGAAYLFVRSGASWRQQSYLKASNPGLGDYFGEHVAVDGDTAVVGAAREMSGAAGINQNEADESMPNAGAVYVFR